MTSIPCIELRPKLMIDLFNLSERITNWCQLDAQFLSGSAVAMIEPLLHPGVCVVLEITLVSAEVTPGVEQHYSGAGLVSYRVKSADTF